eukprot:TRINITY_DN36904_c0_g1_i1.p1 TRINITY_DN36904_c0_g1~~TRINITY_DN36904_c0_g1_i1.p1  ORF type:complete len:407 (+),score=106.38 TRINITY_DN36904_c0_g1_i1:54-1274(+)
MDPASPLSGRVRWSADDDAAAQWRTSSPTTAPGRADGRTPSPGSSAPPHAGRWSPGLREIGVAEAPPAEVFRHPERHEAVIRVLRQERAEAAQLIEDLSVRLQKSAAEETRLHSVVHRSQRAEQALRTDVARLRASAEDLRRQRDSAVAESRKAAAFLSEEREWRSRNEAQLRAAAAGAAEDAAAAVAEVAKLAAQLQAAEAAAAKSAAALRQASSPPAAARSPAPARRPPTADRGTQVSPPRVAHTPATRVPPRPESRRSSVARSNRGDDDKNLPSPVSVDVPDVVSPRPPLASTRAPSSAGGTPRRQSDAASEVARLTGSRSPSALADHRVQQHDGGSEGEAAELHGHLAQLRWQNRRDRVSPSVPKKLPELPLPSTTSPPEPAKDIFNSATVARRSPSPHYIL